MKNEALYLICLKFFETLHPNFCIDKNELNKRDELSEQEDNEILIDKTPSIDEIIRDEENSSIETNDIDEENISLVTTIENSIESKTNELPSEPPLEPNKDKSDLCSCIKKFGLCFGSKIKKSD
jgi:hypothetical protein